MTATPSPMPAPGSVRWVKATLIGSRTEVPGTRTLVIDSPDFVPALAGQHVDIRLTAADGYTAQRSYSLASAAGAKPFEITVDRLPDGEVSPYLVDGVEIGDMLEVRGPIGLWFVWRPVQVEPVTLIAGGSGVVPLMSMIRTRAAADTGGDFRLLYSTRMPERFIYGQELMQLDAEADWFTLSTLYTRQAPPSDARGAHRLNADDLRNFAFAPEMGSSIYVCGPTPFVEIVADTLMTLGHDPAKVRTERFGASG